MIQPFTCFFLPLYTQVHTTSLKMGKSKRYRSFSGQVLDGGSPSRIPI